MDIQFKPKKDAEMLNNLKLANLALQKIHNLLSLGLDNKVLQEQPHLQSLRLLQLIVKRGPRPILIDKIHQVPLP